MNALDFNFGFSVTHAGKTMSLRQGDDICLYPTAKHSRFGEDLTSRQIDLVWIASAVHAADSWARRSSKRCGVRNPILAIEVFDPTFWSSNSTMDLLKKCVDFVSGGDDWQFTFFRSKNSRQNPNKSLFPNYGHDVLVSPYSGGLDSSTGLAIRAASQPGRVLAPVTIRHQMQKSRLISNQFGLLMNRGILRRVDFNPFQAGAFVRKKHIMRSLNESFREVSHRCRPFLFMSVAGVVANSFSAPEVEVFESGVGAINFPLVTGAADHRTTRSTHPTFLRLLSALVSHVNDSAVQYVLPFADKTKAEMVTKLKDLDLGDLARRSVSCILHPLKRKAGRQCGYCPACVYRRQAMITADIAEGRDTYEIDLFIEANPSEIASNRMRAIHAFHQQVARLAELESGVAPACFRQYLKTTNAVESEEQIASYAEIYRRYRREWVLLISEARRRGFPWLPPSRSPDFTAGAAA